MIELKKDLDFCPLKDNNEQKTHGGYYISQAYYPGQTLFGSISDLANTKWLITSSDMQTIKKHKVMNKKVNN